MHVTGMLSMSTQAANESKSPGTATCASLYSFTALLYLLISDPCAAAPLAIHSSIDAKAGGTQLGHPAHSQPQARPTRPPLASEKRGIPPARPVRYVQSVMGKRVAAGGELAVHQHEWEGELERVSSPCGAPPPRLDEACAPAPPIHALGASNRLGQVFMVRRSVPYHAFMPRCSASTSPPCSCSRAGAFLWGGLARSGRDGGLRAATPLLPTCAGLFPTAAPSSPLLLGRCSESPLWPWRQCSWPAQGDAPRSNFRAAVQGWGAPWDGCASSFMYVRLRVVRPSLTSAEWDLDAAGAGALL